jgi:hypothetical protein
LASALFGSVSGSISGATTGATLRGSSTFGGGGGGVAATGAGASGFGVLQALTSAAIAAIIANFVELLLMVLPFSKLKK